MRPATLAPANIASSAAKAAGDVSTDSPSPDAVLSVKATSAGGDLEARNQAAKISSTPTPTPSTSTTNISTPSKGVWSLVDKSLGSLKKASSAIQEKHGDAIKQVVQAGNKGSLLANVISLAEPVVSVAGPVGTGATNGNLITTGVEGFLRGLRNNDITYALFKLADALMFMVPREHQFGMRLGPSGYNLALATRQQNNIETYGTFSEGIKKNLEQVGDYIKGLGKFGLIDGYKPENADKSKVFAVGGPLQGLIGSTGMILSYLPFMSQPVKNVLKSTGYASRFAGAVAIDFSEAMSKHAQSQFSGAAKMDFLAGAASDLMNKVAERTKHTLVSNMKMSENSLPVKVATGFQLLFKNLTPTLESLGRVVSARGVEAGITNEKYKTVGFRGILSKWVESHMDALLGIRAKGTDVAANAIVPAKLTVEAKLKAADKAVAGSSSNSKVSSSSSYSSSLREDYSDSSSSRVAAAAGEKVDRQAVVAPARGESRDESKRPVDLNHDLDLLNIASSENIPVIVNTSSENLPDLLDLASSENAPSLPSLVSEDSEVIVS
jgi:hypothetical protein